MAWNGLEVIKLGNGLNAPVYSLNVMNIKHEQVLVVTGAFTLAFQSSGRPPFQCEGLALWNGTEWLAFGPNFVQGYVTVARTNGSYGTLLYLGGLLRPLDLNHIAVFNGSYWSGIGGGIEGGIITDMTVWGERLVFVETSSKQEGKQFRNLQCGAVANGLELVA